MGCGMTLNTSRYFNGSTAGGSYSTSVNLSTSGAATPVQGTLQLLFTASDNDGLALAWLQRNGDLVGEMALSGTKVSGTFSTPYFTPGTADQYTVTVYDVYGNRASSARTVTPATGTTRAPQPYITMTPAVALPGEAVRYDASSSTDPDGNTSTMKVEWDFDGDGVYDTAPSTVQWIIGTATTPGTQFVSVRTTDATSAVAVSSAVAFHVHKPSLGIALSAGNVPGLSWDTKCGFTYQLQDSADLTAWSPLTLANAAGDGTDFSYLAPAPITGARFFKVSAQKSN